MRTASRALTIVLALQLAGCASIDLTKFRTVSAAAAPRDAGWHGLPIESGQIVVSEFPGADSLFLSLFSQRYAPWVHAGVIVIEEGDAYVYESFGFYFPMPWESPNDHMGGGVRRVTLDSFLRRGAIAALYQPPASLDRAATLAFVRRHLRERTRFDGRFDAADASKFYCVEFVARALEAGGAAPIHDAPLSANRSMRVVLDWLHMNSADLLIAGDVVDETRRVALLSARYSEKEIAAYFELKRELHRRFTAEQRLGDLFVWTGSQLTVRPQIAAYFDAGMRTEVDARTLAVSRFGPFADAESVPMAAAR